MLSRLAITRLLFAALRWLGGGCVLFFAIHLYLNTASVLRARFDKTPFTSSPRRMGNDVPPVPLPERVACIGARGGLLSDGGSNEAQFETLDGVVYPMPFLGSQKELGLEQTWATAESRYGPYGFVNDGSVPASQPLIDWDTVDWGQLQQQCLKRNDHRFPTSSQNSNSHYKRFTLFKDSKLQQKTPSWDAFNKTRRTAVVLRSYSSLKYKPQIMWYVRSIITEAALYSGGEYSVFLLVHVQSRWKGIFDSEAQYEAAFAAAGIPPELQSIAILWDDNLIESWYSKVGEHETLYQVNQPMQLFALHYPEFDHYWQLEMDIRFLGHVGKYLDAVATFARQEPRKQALERATFTFDEAAYGTYTNFTAGVNKANDGKTRAWGPVVLPNILPVGPEPKVQPEEDDYTWGVGEDADFIPSSYCTDIRDSVWGYKHWHQHLAFGEETPRWFCPPATSRMSRTLALVVHEAQHRRGIAVPSEATLPTFTLWHGLKLSFPPLPAYLRPPEPGQSQLNQDTWRQRAQGTANPWLGSSTEQSTDGTAHGNAQELAEFGLTWWWTSTYGEAIMSAWLAGGSGPDAMPPVLAVKDGKVYAPNFAMHPVKAQRM